jgi:protein-S-isoprenylcysteine O-methyltransferase Ste14
MSNVYYQLMFVFEALAETSSILAASFPSTLSSLVLEKLTGSSSTPVWTFTPSLIWTAGTLLAIGGGAFRLWSYRALGKHFTFQLAVLKDHSLITTGPYAIVRHPGYTGLIAMCIGNSLAIGADGSWSREVLFPDLFLEPWGFNARMLTWKRLFVIGNLAGQTVLAAALVARTKKEDKMLKDEFGGQWDKWAEKTPWALIPGVY